MVSLPEKWDATRHPFNVPALARGIDLAIRTNVTFFVGENGTGKSTLLEALAECCGFNPEGGNRDHHRATFAERSDLAQALRLSWAPKVTEGFFIATHSPIILSYPRAVICSVDGDAIREVTYHETNHYRLMRDFLNAPERYFKHLFDSRGDEETDA